ncbi:helix-turn-helix domain-containing protein [Dactylosporangium aurantiacum]|uniref:Helix-turn-helix domain-containing protein n=1 Tax=Dactylosporangium aurantiacum TaxID=35754 RepID=A0A9Q9IC86_9ACTN|nr:helix-turn-helix transcriptional regulator [Dactylosporangium aurantiacum]MDG6105224.1 helix-turn-helix transcriptional regulator [Dactylosporangium aurantiacum]UWZ51738.1 helix-turn-helix domain-containing protein [Dactylosporangium aurantiacum]
MQRDELADFLRRRRLAIRPADVGLVEGPRRRTAGLRREEVALLAGMSTDYVVRLEQGRSAQPSAQLLSALARALRLTEDERDHLYHLAGVTPPRTSGGVTHARAGLLRMLDLLGDTPATVASDLGETLAQNRMAMLLLGDQTRFRGDERYHVWRWFTDPQWRALYPAQDADHHGRVSVADLRATAARRHGDADVDGLVRRLLAASPEFAALWGEHEVAVRRSDRKRIVNRQVGLVHVDCETLVTPDLGQKLLVLTPQPGTDAAEKLALLSVVGLQHFST